LTKRINGIEDFFLSGFDPYWFWTMAVVLLVLAVIGIAPVRLEPNIGSHGTLMVYSRRVFLSFFAALLTLLAGAATVLPDRIGNPLTAQLLGEWAWRWWAFLLSALAVGLCVRFLWQRYAAPWISEKTRALRTEQDTEELSDIRNSISLYKAIDYNPPDYYKPDQIFTGLNAARQPIYMSLKVWYETHKTLVGATRFGKGITAQIWADQIIRRGDALIYIDPKFDDFMPHVLRQICAEVGRKFIVLDLVDPNAPGAWGPFIGGTPADRRSRFYDVMDMADRGTDADHYKAGARMHMFKLFDAQAATTIGGMLHEVEAASAGDEDTAKTLSTVRSRLTEWNAYAKLAPKSGRGFSVEQSLINGAVVYVRGSLDDLVVSAATRALIMEIVQEARRLKPQRSAALTLMVDELRFTLSETLLRALATVLGSNVNIVTMFQNFGDLAAPTDTRIDGEGALQTVRTNSQVKMLFGGTDPETAEWIADSSGTRLKKITQMEQTEVNRSGGETFAPVRRLKNEEENYIPINDIMGLPPRVGVLFRPHELAEIVAVDKIALKPAAAAHPGPSPAPSAPQPPPASPAPAKPAASGAKGKGKPKAAAGGSP
jgi:hypothetical protein